MAKKRRPKTRPPTDPAEIARRLYEQRRNPALWGTNDEAMKLENNADVRQEGETRTRTRRVQRFDCFATLDVSLPAFQAVRRYQADLAESFGCGGRESLVEVVDGRGSAELVTSASLAASRRCERLREALSPADARLLDALSIPSHVFGEQPNWKAIVLRLRGLKDRGSAGRAVKDMAEAVRVGYVAVDGPARRAA